MAKKWDMKSDHEMLNKEKNISKLMLSTCHLNFKTFNIWQDKYVIKNRKTFMNKTSLIYQENFLTFKRNFLNSENFSTNLWRYFGVLDLDSSRLFQEFVKTSKQLCINVHLYTLRMRVSWVFIQKSMSKITHFLLRQVYSW